jgi:glycosyltransferase involved in cell wall biosynthesis
MDAERADRRPPPGTAPAPRLSIITICFNSAATLPDTFASLRAQRDPRIEYIVVDGGSSDTTRALLRDHSDLIDAWVSEPDEGTSDALNKGVAMARGDDLWFVNADDWIEPGAIAAVLALPADAGPHEGRLLIGHTRYVSRDGATLYTMRCDARSLARIHDTNPVPYPSTLISRSLFLRCGGFSRTYEIVNDYEFFLRALATGPRVRFIDRVLANMRDGGQSSSQASVANRARHQLELFRVQRAHLSLARAGRAQAIRLLDFVRTRSIGARP